MKKPHRILVVDGSRVVRATLTKQLGGTYEVLEEGNGESAWQVLMLDHQLSLVIAGGHLPKLEALELLTRVRASSIRRLREMPFVLIVSDLDNQAARDNERSRGANAFLLKTMKQAEMLAILSGLLEPPAQSVAPLPIRKSKAETVAPVQPTLLNGAKFDEALAGMTLAPVTEPVSALVFGIDGREMLIARFGQEAAVRIEERFASLLLSKLGPRDLAGQCSGARLGVISRGVDLLQAVRFGKKVCKGLAAGQIMLRGEKVRLTASVGVASTSDDVVGTAAELLGLANQRLGQARICGGNTVITEVRAGCPGYCVSDDMARIVAALRSPETMIDSGELAVLARQILPLLRVMDRHLGLQLPLAQIERQIATSGGVVAAQTQSDSGVTGSGFSSFELLSPVDG